MIEVGEYVRTNRGEICKVLGISPELRDGKRLYSHKSYYLDTKKGSLTEPFIINHSKNIIKLIEESDYVNGYKVLAIEKYFEVQPYRISIMVYKTKDAEFWKSLEEQDIKNVVTKEQFSSVEYRLE